MCMIAWCMGYELQGIVCQLHDVHGCMVHELQGIVCQLHMHDCMVHGVYALFVCLSCVFLCLMYSFAAVLWAFYEADSFYDAVVS